MADRFPLIVDISDGNKIKELPSGDNLNLENSGIVKADSIQTGTVDTVALQVDGRTLNEIAFTGDYEDLIANVPSGFSGSWDDLTDIPIELRKNNLPLKTKKLGDVSSVNPDDGQVLVFRGTEYQPEDISDQFDLSDYSIGDLNDVAVVGNTTNTYLKFENSAWQPSFITWGEIEGKPPLESNSEFDNDRGYLDTTSLDAYISTDSTITYQNGAISVTNNSITSSHLDVADTGEIGDSLHSTGDGAFVWRNPYVEQAAEPDNPLPGDEWFDSVNRIYYKYLGGHWVYLTEYDITVTESGDEINTESGNAIDFN